jgi:gluconate kinase
MAEELPKVDPPPAKPKKNGGVASQRFTLTAAGIAACLAAVPSIITAARGEPVAEQTWTTLKAQVDKQSEVINKMHRRLIYFQAKEESRTAMQLQAQLEALQKKYDELKSQKSSVPKAPEKHAVAKCKQGQVLGSDSRCHWVRKAVAAKVKESKSEALALRRKLAVERRYRKMLEKRKRDLARKFKAATKAQTILHALPARPMEKK